MLGAFSDSWIDERAGGRAGERAVEGKKTLEGWRAVGGGKGRCATGVWRHEAGGWRRAADGGRVFLFFWAPGCFQFE